MEYNALGHGRYTEEPTPTPRCFGYTLLFDGDEIAHKRDDLLDRPRVRLGGLGTCVPRPLDDADIRRHEDCEGAWRVAGPAGGFEALCRCCECMERCRGVGVVVEEDVACVLAGGIEYAQATRVQLPIGRRGTDSRISGNVSRMKVRKWVPSHFVPGLPQPSCVPAVACEMCAITAVRLYSVAM